MVYPVHIYLPACYTNTYNNVMLFTVWYHHCWCVEENCKNNINFIASQKRRMSYWIKVNNKFVHRRAKNDERKKKKCHRVNETLSWETNKLSSIKIIFLLLKNTTIHTYAHIILPNQWSENVKNQDSSNNKMFPSLKQYFFIFFLKFYVTNLPWRECTVYIESVWVYLYCVFYVCCMSVWLSSFSNNFSSYTQITHTHK